METLHNIGVKRDVAEEWLESLEYTPSDRHELWFCFIDQHPYPCLGITVGQYLRDIIGFREELIPRLKIEFRCLRMFIDINDSLEYVVEDDAGYPPKIDLLMSDIKGWVDNC